MVAASQTRQTEGRSKAVGLRQTLCGALCVDMNRLKQVVAVTGGKSPIRLVVEFTLLAKPMVLLML